MRDDERGQDRHHEWGHYRVYDLCGEWNIDDELMFMGEAIVDHASFVQFWSIMTAFMVDRSWLRP